jgi:hypothetical protein
VMALEVADLPLRDMMTGIVAPIASFCEANPGLPPRVRRDQRRGRRAHRPTRRGCTRRW